MKRLVAELAGYTAASAAALLVDMVVLWSLVHFFALEPVLSATLSFLAGAVVSYQLAITIAFKEHRLYDRRAEFVSFMAIGAVSLALNAAVMYLCTRYLNLHFMIAKCVAAGFTFSCNFVARRQLLFVRRRSV